MLIESGSCRAHVHVSTYDRFGTLLYNCEKERRDERVHEKTASLWTYLEVIFDYICNVVIIWVQNLQSAFTSEH